MYMNVPTSQNTIWINILRQYSKSQKDIIKFYYSLNRKKQKENK